MKTYNNIPIGSRRTICPQEVVLLTADVNYTRLYMSDGVKIVVATTLKELEKRFAKCSEFFRTHKSYLININYIENYDFLVEKEFIQMNNGYRVTISRRKKRAFQERVLSISQTS